MKVMRCDCCDNILSDYETSLKAISTGDYINTCLKCLDGLGIDVAGNNKYKRKHDEIPPEVESQLDEELQELVRQQQLDMWETDE